MPPFSLILMEILGKYYWEEQRTKKMFYSPKTNMETSSLLIAKLLQNYIRKTRQIIINPFISCLVGITDTLKRSVLEAKRPFSRLFVFGRVGQSAV